MRTSFAAVLCAVALATALPLVTGLGRRILPQDHPQLPDTNWQARDGQPRTNPGAANTTTIHITQPVDQFSFSSDSPTWQERVLVNMSHWEGCPADGSGSGPIFFYTGNEGNVELYADSCGLMWENAQAFRAALVFAEHRYYGSSLPFGANSTTGSNIQYLTHEQAMADYVTVIAEMKTRLVSQAAAAGCSITADSVPVIAFGGSYGGMLSSWFRMRYPQVVDGAIAASAPIFGFDSYGYDGESYWKVATADAEASPGGSAPACSANVRKAFAAVLKAAETAEGRATLSSIFRTCQPIQSPSGGMQLALFFLWAWDTLAMGDYAHSSNYITAGGPMLPPFPVRVACDQLADEKLEGDALLMAFSKAGAVFNNATGTVQCYTLPALTPQQEYDDGVLWGFQHCTELLPEETFFPRNGFDDMFYAFNITASEVAAECKTRYGAISPDPDHIFRTYGSKETIIDTATNIVFSNGALDPWSSCGVGCANLSSTLPAFCMEDAAHHLDLFFSDPADPPSVVAARQFEVRTIAKWLAARRARDDAP